MKLLLAGIETRQNDPDRWPLDAAPLAQPARHGDAAERKLDALGRDRQFRHDGRIAAQHGVMRGAKLLGMGGKQVLAVVIVNRSAARKLRRRSARGPVRPPPGKPLVACGLHRSAAAPLLPAADALHQFPQVVRIDAGRLIARNEMREDQVDLRIGRHGGFLTQPFCADHISTTICVVTTGVVQPRRNARLRSCASLLYEPVASSTTTL